jgi:hypothetical protein
MDLYGVSYYVAFTPDATRKAADVIRLEQLGNPEPFTVFALPPTELVVPATHLPAVYDPEMEPPATLPEVKSFHEVALDWYEDIDEMHRWVVADGPEDWPRVRTLSQRPETPLAVPDDAVSDIEVDHHRIAFDTTAVGVPHLVKVSYFPNWAATGAEGPYRAAPSLMVVVPTEEHVEISFVNTWPETLGWVLTLVGVTALVVWVLAERWRLSAASGDDES